MVRPSARASVFKIVLITVSPRSWTGDLARAEKDQVRNTRDIVIERLPLRAGGKRGRRARYYDGQDRGRYLMGNAPDHLGFVLANQDRRTEPHSARTPASSIAR